MKRVNFWKTLFFTVLAAGAFAGCSNDDSDDGGTSGMPSVTVNGGGSALLSVQLTGGSTTPVEIVSSGNWTLSVVSEGVSCNPSQSSGGKGTSSVTFNVGGTQQERPIVVKVTTTGKIPGVDFESTASATILILQTDAYVPTTSALYAENCGAGDVSNKPSVSSYKDWSRKGTNTQSGVWYGGSGASLRNNGKNYDPTTLEEALVSAYPYVYFGYQSESRFDIYNINVESATNLTFTFTANLQSDYKDGEGPVFSDPAPAINLYASVDRATYSPITFRSIQIDPEGSWYYCLASFKLPEGTTTKNVTIRIAGATTVDGVADISGYQLRIDDFKLYEGGDGNAMPAPAPPTTVTIDGVTETEKLYEVENVTVVGTYKQGFVIQDNTGAILVYTGTDENIPAEGNTVTLSGLCSVYGGAKQLSLINLEESVAGTMPELNPTEVTEANVGTMMTELKATYVKMTGTLSSSTSNNITYYNVEFNFDSEYKGSITYPNTELNVDSFIGKMVDVEGWFVNNGNGNYFTVVARSIKENTTAVIGKFTSTLTAFDATDPQPQNLTFEANAAAGTVKFEITGTNADKFTYSDQTASTVTVKAVGDNASSGIYSATLQLQAEDGTVLDEIALTQKTSGVSQEYTQIRKVADLTEGEYFIGGYGTSAKVLSLYTGSMSGGNGQTSTYTYEEKNGSLTTTSSYTAVSVTLEAVSGIVNAYKIKDTKSGKYIIAKKAASGELTYIDATDMYWVLSDGPDGSIEQDLVAKMVDPTGTIENAALVISTSATSKLLRSWNFSGNNKANGLVFFKKNF